MGVSKIRRSEPCPSSLHAPGPHAISHVCTIRGGKGILFYETGVDVTKPETLRRPELWKGVTQQRSADDCLLFCRGLCG
eukprot:scaffold65522_cov19-Tisochrysis_lutea.AAC.2